MLSLLYVSRSRLPENTAAEQLRTILDVSAQRNRRQDLTGALIYTGTHFAQILEGPEQGVAAVMASIAVDLRHEEVAVMQREAIYGRSFASWGMGLIAHDTAIAQQIRSVHAARAERGVEEAVARLIATMRSSYIVPAD